MFGREFDSPQLHTLKPATGAGFRFLKTNPDKTRTEFMQYKPPKIKGEYPAKFIEYFYRHPETDKWQRFKVYEDINRYKSLGYDTLLLKSVSLPCRPVSILSNIKPINGPGTGK